MSVPPPLPPNQLAGRLQAVGRGPSPAVLAARGATPAPVLSPDTTPVLHAFQEFLAAERARVQRRLTVSLLLFGTAAALLAGAAGWVAWTHARGVRGEVAEVRGRILELGEQTAERAESLGSHLAQIEAAAADLVARVDSQASLHDRQLAALHGARDDSGNKLGALQAAIADLQRSESDLRASLLALREELRTPPPVAPDAGTPVPATVATAVPLTPTPLVVTVTPPPQFPDYLAIAMPPRSEGKPFRWLMSLRQPVSATN